MDCRINKHTNATLAAAKANSVSLADNKILITVECRIKSGSKREQRQTDPNLGKRAKPWSKDRFLSGIDYFLHPTEQY